MRAVNADSHSISLLSFSLPTPPLTSHHVSVCCKLLFHKFMKIRTQLLFYDTANSGHRQLALCRPSSGLHDSYGSEGPERSCIQMTSHPERFPDITARTGLTYEQIAKAIGKDEVWVAAAFFGQVRHLLRPSVPLAISNVIVLCARNVITRSWESSLGQAEC